MKYLIICIAFFLAACSKKSDKGIRGMYAGFSTNEYGSIEDTLIVVKANSGEGIYQIYKHTGLIKIVDGKKLPKGLSTETWTLEFDLDKQTLFELKAGKTLIWNSSKETLQLGRVEYKKIANL